MLFSWRCSSSVSHEMRNTPKCRQGIREGTRSHGWTGECPCSNRRDCLVAGRLQSQVPKMRRRLWWGLWVHLSGGTQPISGDGERAAGGVMVRSPYPAAGCCRWRRNRRPRRHGDPIQLNPGKPGLHLFPPVRLGRHQQLLPADRDESALCELAAYPPRTAVPGLPGVPPQTGDAGPTQAGALKEIMAATVKGGQEEDEDGADLAPRICPTCDVFIGGLRSRPEFRSGTWQTNGIASLRVNIERPRSEDA